MYVGWDEVAGTVAKTRGGGYKFVFGWVVSRCTRWGYDVVDFIVE